MNSDEHQCVPKGAKGCLLGGTPGGGGGGTGAIDGDAGPEKRGMPCGIELGIETRN